MAIVALVLWTFTVAAGVYLLITSTRPAGERAAHDEPLVAQATALVEAGTAAEVGTAFAPGGAARPAAPAKPDRNRFDPPSLARAKSEPMPGLRALAEFGHPLLGITGFGIFIGYVLTRDWFLGVIALGVGLGTVAAGVSWATANARAAKRAASGARDPHAMKFTPRLLLLHGAGAALTILLAALIAARV